MEDQAVEIVGQIGQGQFRLGPGDANGADEQAEPVLLMGEHMLDLARIEDLAALARAVAMGIGLPLDLRRWMRLVIIRSASQASLLCER